MGWLRKKSPQFWLGLGLALLLGGCKADQTTKSLIETAERIPDGTYLVGQIAAGEALPARTLCASDAKRPSLSATIATTAALSQLAKFGDLVTNKLTVTLSGNSITKVWHRDSGLTKVYPAANTTYADASCDLTWTGTLVQNDFTVFQEAGSYQISWSPSTCAIELHNWANTGGSTGLGQWVSATSTAGVFLTTTGTTAQDPWTVITDPINAPGQFILQMPDSVAAKQTNYSCNTTSKAVKQLWVKQ